MAAKSKSKKQKEEENRRIKEWEIKFDEEQKKKEEELIRKFYSDNDQTIGENKDDLNENPENKDN